MAHTTVEGFKKSIQTNKQAGAHVRKDVLSNPQPIGDRQVRFTLTTPALDRTQDSVDPHGVDFTNYLKNPVVLFGHDDHNFPIGKCVSISVEQDSVVGVVEFVPEEYGSSGDRANQVLKHIQGGFLSAVSIGFRPLEFEFNEEGGMNFSSVELLEFSVVTVPCNHEALVIEVGSAAQAASNEPVEPTDAPESKDIKTDDKRTKSNWNRRKRQIALLG